jgi:hypothetical protein
MRKITSDPVPWIVGLFAVNFLVQRLSIPNLSIPIITPLMFVWMVLVLWARVAEVNARRLLLWLLATSVSGSASTAGPSGWPSGCRWSCS